MKIKNKKPTNRQTDQQNQPTDRPTYQQTNHTQGPRPQGHSVRSFFKMAVAHTLTLVPAGLTRDCRPY